MADPFLPTDDDFLDACCDVCASSFHASADHPVSSTTARGPEGGVERDFPPGYDPAEADRLIGRDPSHLNRSSL